MKYLTIIQARCGSSRLPNKVMTDLCGKPVLQRVIERVERSKLIDEVMVVTSISKENLPIVKLCADNDIRVGIGSETDVLDRYYQVAKLLQPEYVIRVTADCPLFDGKLLDEAIMQLNSESDYLGMISESFADGLDLEIIKYSALEEAWKCAEHSFEREHVTQYIIRRPDKFLIQNFESTIGYFGNQRWTVDCYDDLEMVRRVYEYFLEQGVDFGYREVYGFLETNPDVMEINIDHRRNEGLEKSIREDRLLKTGDAL